MPSWIETAQSHVLHVPGFSFSCGEKRDLTLHCRTLGTLNEARDNAVLLLHGTTGSSQQFLKPEMADYLFAEGRPLPAAHYFLIMPDAIGHGRSSKPSTDGGQSFPRYSYGDMVRAQEMLVESLFGISRLKLILGTSMGGMNTWMWGTMFPQKAEALLPVACLPHRITGQNLFFRRLILAMIEEELFRGDSDRPSPAVGLAWNLFQMLTLSVTGMSAEFPDAPTVDDYILNVAREASQTHHPLDVLWEFRASFDYDPGAESGQIVARLLTINFADDQINAPGFADLDRVVRAIPGARSVILDPGGQSRGHQTHSQAEVWKDHVFDLLGAGRSGRPLD